MPRTTVLWLLRFGLIGAAIGLGFIAGPVVGGALGSLGPRWPFYAAATLAATALTFGFFVLPETLTSDKRRAFEWRRANPFGAFKVFATYSGVLPMCAVLAAFFFFSSVYPAIWPFWAKARFGWSEAMIGVTLAVFGVIMAFFQGVLSGPAVKRFGEFRTVMIGLVSATIAATGYGLAGGLAIIVVLMVIHGPEGFVHPMLTALMSQRVPENAQGELQGGISAITNIAMLVGTIFFAQVFGYFLAGPMATPSMAFFIAGGGLLLTLGLFLWVVGHDGGKT
jgi:DHA1 family tetracycline resistance protein-like MFS transporter